MSSQQLDNTIIIGQRIPSQNEREKKHWAEQYRERNQWVTLLRYCIAPVPATPSQHQHIVITSYRAQLIHDQENLVGGGKALVDAMVHVGLMIDDSKQWVTIEFEQAKCTRKEERTEIFIDGFRPIRPLRTYRKVIR